MVTYLVHNVKPLKESPGGARRLRSFIFHRDAICVCFNKITKHNVFSRGEVAWRCRLGARFGTVHIVVAMRARVFYLVLVVGCNLVLTVVSRCGGRCPTRPLILMLWGPIAGYVSSTFRLRATYAFLFYYSLRVSWDMGWLLSGGITW